MKQAISGVTPSSEQEATVMTVWPSIAVYPDGQWLGRMYSIKAGFWVVTAGNLIAFASIPHALFRYFYRLVTGKCYKLTNRRVIELGTKIEFSPRLPPFVQIKIGAEVRSVPLDRFESIDLVRRPGHEWFDAGDLVFKHGNVEAFRLEGVSRPESFRHTCMKTRNAYVGVKQAMRQQAAPA